MRGIDTNVLVRFLVDGDNADQARRARSVFEAGDVFIPSTVMLESEWVLRSTYGFRPAQIVDALRTFSDLPGVTLEEPARITLALDWMEAGMDFADALHLAKVDGCSAFLSFDLTLAKRADGRSPVPVRAP